MARDRDTKNHGPGIGSYFSKRRNGRVYMISYYWRGKRQAETVPDPYCRTTGRGSRTEPLRGCEAAKAMKADRERRRLLSDWMPPKVAKKLESERAEKEASERAPLLFEAAVERFLEDAEATDRYSDGGVGARAAFRALSRVFAGRMLDEVRMPEIRRYFIDRARCTGPFENWPYPVTTVRPAEGDVRHLSTLYTWLKRAEGHHVFNPCHRPTGGGKNSVLAPYRRRHVPVTPGPEKLRALFAAKRKAKIERQLITDADRVFFALCYYTAARPESEPCRLKHADVRFLGDGWAEVSYRDTKNHASQRTIPVPPDVAEALRSVMEEEPSRFERARREKWAERYIFRRAGRESHWGSSSYRDAWAHALAVVGGLDGMWLRDLRTAANTRLGKAGIRLEVRKRFLGHTVDVHGGYDNVDADDLRAAAEALRLDRIGELSSSARA